MQTIQGRTIRDENIIQTRDHYRYVNHVDRLATTGFTTRDKLIEYTDCIRFDSGTLALMRSRYEELFNE